MGSASHPGFGPSSELQTSISRSQVGAPQRQSAPLKNDRIRLAEVVSVGVDEGHSSAIRSPRHTERHQSAPVRKRHNNARDPSVNIRKTDANADRPGRRLVRVDVEQIWSPRFSVPCGADAWALSPLGARSQEGRRNEQRSAHPSMVAQRVFHVARYRHDFAPRAQARAVGGHPGSPQAASRDRGRSRFRLLRRAGGALPRIGEGST